jgi:hypothetical protein
MEQTMKVQKLFRYFVPAAMLVGTAVVWWACDFEKTIDQVGPTEPLNMPLTQILNELAASQTPQAAEKAITHLLEKTGIGLPVKGSNYNEYYLPAEFVSNLAQEHLLYRRGEDSTSWAAAFDRERIVADDEWATPLEFNDVTARLQQQTPAAQADPESPNHALLLAMLAPETALSGPIAAPDTSSAISPVQEFLFEVWMSAEFGDLNSLEKKKPKGYTHFKFVSVDCDKKGREKEYKEQVKVPWNDSDAKKCMEKVRTRYEKEVKTCFKAYDKCYDKNKKARKDDDYGPDQACCAELQNCLSAAHEQALLDINDCLAGHDQGEGGHHDDDDDDDDHGKH